jgi:hypothetical protein
VCCLIWSKVPNDGKVLASYKAYKVISKQDIDDGIVRVYVLEHKKSHTMYTLVVTNNGVEFTQMFVEDTIDNTAVPASTTNRYGEKIK